MSTREEKAVAAEVARFQAAGWTIDPPPRLAQTVPPCPPRAAWLRVWRELFKDSRHP